MIIVIFAIIGAGIGAYFAKKRGGNWLDIVHLSTIYALIFILIASFATIFLVRFIAPVLS